jgi:tripartite ATP-independent transporter DctM subunit
MTPTEAAAVAAAYALLISLTIYRSVTFANLYASLLSSARTSASIGMLIGGALVFNYVVTVENIPETVRGLLTGYDLSPTGFLLIVNAILLVLGCVLEGTAILLIVVPVFIPIDLVHFGVMVVVNIMLGLVTPPYGLLLFVMTSITGVPLRAIVREVMPYLAVMIAALAIITFVPETVLWLPRLFGYEGN